MWEKTKNSVVLTIQIYIRWRSRYRENKKEKKENREKQKLGKFDKKRKENICAAPCCDVLWTRYYATLPSFLFSAKIALTLIAKIDNLTQEKAAIPFHTLIRPRPLVRTPF